MTRHLHHADRGSRRWTWPALFAAVAMASIAGCTTAAEPTAHDAASAVTSPAASPARHADAAVATSTGSQAATTTASALTPAGSTPTSATTPRTTSAAPRTTAPADRTTSSTDAAPSTSRRAPATTSAPRTVNSATSSPRPPTTAVAPPTEGNIRQTVPTEAQVTLEAAPLTAPARPDKGVTVEVTDVRAVSTEARFPGEISGPGIAVTIQVVNSSAAALDLDNAIVDVRGSDGTRAIAVTGSPAAPMSGPLPAGQQTSGVYVFTIPQDQRSPISVRFSYAAETPTVLFVGDAP